MGKQNFIGTEVSYESFLTEPSVYPVVSPYKMVKGWKKWEPLVQNKCPGFQVGFTQEALCTKAGFLQGDSQKAVSKLNPKCLRREG